MKTFTDGNPSLVLCMIILDSSRHEISNEASNGVLADSGLPFHVSTTGFGLAWVFWSQTAPVTRISILTSFWILPDSTSSVYVQQHSFDEASSIETVHGMGRCFGTWSTVWLEVLDQ